MKSHVSEPLLEVAMCVYKDALAKCTASMPDIRDMNTIVSRVKGEGLSFLTITLPTFGADFDVSLSRGMVASNLFRSFRKRLAIPAFLQGMLRHIFDEATGRILNEPDIAAIEGVRQIAYTFKKLLVPCSKEREDKTVSEFVAIEHELQGPVAQDDIQYFRDICAVLWDNIFFRDFDPYVDTVPRHGPGQTCERITGNQKYVHKTWHERLEPYFPFVETAYANAYSMCSKEVQDVTFVTEEQELPVRVTLVPKTLKGPRVIAIEPVCMQYTQQALSKYLMGKLERSRLTAGHVNFTDQAVNQALALTASRDMSYATLDLSSASDRVPRSLALAMFDGNPVLRDCIDACRSTRAQLPNREIIPLKKFASMGSALCFPVESMYFYTLCIGALLAKRDLPVTYRNVVKMSRHVFVYGDDLIVPTGDAEVVIDYLQKYYCKVGPTKSHWIGKFRESCGVDAYDGEVVTPTYLRRIPPHNKRNSDSIISWVATANQFYLKGYWRVAEHMFHQCETIIGRLPYVGPESAGLGRQTFLQRRTIGRWNPKLMRYEVKAYVPFAAYRSDRIVGQAALIKSLLHIQSILDGTDVWEAGRKVKCPVTGKMVKPPTHLDRSARHGAATLKCRWIQAG